MSRTDNILDKTKRKEPEAKKWKVVAGIILGLVLSLSILYGLYAVTEPIVKSGDTSLSTIDNLYAFYDLNIGNEETAVYFLGSSLTSFEIYSPLIDEELQKRGYDVTTYNLFVEADTPRLRALQIDEIIESQPALVIYGVSYRTITTNSLHHGRTLASLSHIEFTPELKRFYTDSELISLNHGSFYQKGYVFENLKKAVQYIGTESTPSSPKEISRETALRYAKDSTSSWVKKKSSETKDMDAVIKALDNPTNDWRPVVPSGDTLNKQAFMYNVKKLEEAGIPVVIINMPVSPLLSEKITDESRQNFYDYLDSTGVTWLDMENMYDDSHFFDYIHSTWEGSLDFSQEMVDLIIQELS